MDRESHVTIFLQTTWFHCSFAACLDFESLWAAWAVITELSVRGQSMKLPIWSIPTLWLCSQNRLEQPTYKLGMPFSETYWRLSEQSHTAYKTYLAHIVLLPQTQSLYDGSISPWVKLTEGRPRPTFPVLTLSQCRLSQALTKFAYRSLIYPDVINQSART